MLTYKKASSNISAVFDNWGSVKACYRFFSDKKVKNDIMLQKQMKQKVNNSYTLYSYIAK